MKDIPNFDFIKTLLKNEDEEVYEDEEVSNERSSFCVYSITGLESSSSMNKINSGNSPIDYFGKGPKRPPEYKIVGMGKMMGSAIKSEDAFWRPIDRVKTTAVALCICLNIGIDPPDVMKPQDCARLECWIDPTSQQASVNPSATLELIGRQLQDQYEKWQPRAKYRVCLDPTVEDVKKVCTSLRKSVKDERILFHYNGHGVPKPTDNGEVWVFNKNFTQYIPLSIYDLQTWLGNPSVLVYDCSNGANIIKAFNDFSEQRKRELHIRLESENMNFSSSMMDDCIQMAACGHNETLPLNQNLPADLFTSCLTTPIEMALRWLIMDNPTTTYDITFEMISKLPGKLNDRRTPLGELNWIFTSITDTIAWNSFPNDIFQKLFRQDLLMASLFRNYLLAERIMTSYGCHPTTEPKLPSTSHHPLWITWDFAAETCLRQLPSIIEHPNEYKFSDFFYQQLTAFENWIDLGDYQTVPMQLPIILQVLLSQTHRLKALQLLARYLDTGSKAIYYALSVGIFPYVLKLLQSPAMELYDILTFIWAKILSVDHECQQGLLKENTHKYFIYALTSSSSQNENRAIAAFSLAALCHSCLPAQIACFKLGILPVCYTIFKEKDGLLLRHGILLFGKICSEDLEIRQHAFNDDAHTLLMPHLGHIKADIRATTIFAISKLIFGSNSLSSTLLTDGIIILKILELMYDPNPMVRYEVVSSLILFVTSYHEKFEIISSNFWQQERERFIELYESNSTKIKSNEKNHPIKIDTTEFNSMFDSLFVTIWKALLILSLDSHPQIASKASMYIDSINESFLKIERNIYSEDPLDIFFWNCSHMALSTQEVIKLILLNVLFVLIPNVLD
jgi:regulator-associated protein of mTOR